MSFQEVSYCKLSTIPKQYATEMLYCPSQNWILFIADVITKYDLKNDKYSTISGKNPRKFTDLSFHYLASTVNVKKREVFLISNGPWYCSGDEPTTSVLNLKTEKIKVISINDQYFSGHGIQCLYLPLPTNEIHAFSSTIHGRIHHFVFCEEKQKFGESSTISSESFMMKKILFAKSQQKLIALMLHCKTSKMQLWFAQISDKPYHWKQQAVSFPTGREGVTNFEAINVFDTIIVIFYCRNRHKKEMWCLDLKNKKYEWIKSEKTFPNEYSIIHALTNADNNIHFAYAANHFVIKAADILPKSLRIKYMKMYEDLVNGYHKNVTVNQPFNANFPIVLSKLIASYYCSIFNFNH